MSAPRIGLALGAGGARGLAHIVVVEAMDELGLAPAAIAGTSIGAIIGAARAQGMSGKEMRAAVLAILRDRTRVMSGLMQARVGTFADLFSGLGNPVMVDGERLLDIFWPGQLAASFEELRIPLTLVATDYFGRARCAFDSGPLAPAIAASMAIPGLIRPVEIAGRLLIDGGATDPLPYECLLDTCDVVVACDVAGGPVPGGRTQPSAFEVAIGTTQIMQAAIVAEKLKARAPQVLLRPAVDGYRMLDFHKAGAILRGADAIKGDIKRQIGAALTQP
jgi:NTE family protein